MTARTEILDDGDTFTHDGLQFIVSIEADNDHGAPWDNEDGHGPVSDWVSRDKKPGELVLSSDGYRHRYYDFAEAMRMARRDGWGLAEDGIAMLTARHGRAPTQGEIEAEAVQRDFLHLKGWVNDDWHYVGVCVRHVSFPSDDRYYYATWGIESCSDLYLTETAHELASECARAVRAEIQQEYTSLKTTRATARELIRDIRASATLRPSICTAVRQQLAALMDKRSAAHARIAELTA